MALQPATVEVRLGSKDTKTSDKLSTPGTLTRAENVTMVNAGQYRRRSGTAQVFQPMVANYFNGTSTPAADVTSLGNELLTMSANALVGQETGTGNDGYRSSLISFTSRLTPRGSSNHQGNHRFVRNTTTGWDYHVWLAADGSIRITAYDVASGSTYYQDQFIDGTPGLFEVGPPAIFLVGTTVAVVYAKFTSATASQIRIATIQPGSPTSVPGAGGILVDTTTLAAPARNYAFDCQAKDSSTLAIAYNVTVGGTNRFKLNEWNVTTNTSSATFVSAATYQSTVAIGFLNHTLSDGNYHLTACGTTDWITFTVALGAASGSATALLSTYAGLGSVGTGVAVTGMVQSNLNRHIFLSLSGGALGDRWTAIAHRTSGGTILSIDALSFVTIMSRPWTVSTGESYWLGAFSRDSVGSTYYAFPIYYGGGLSFPAFSRSLTEVADDGLGGPITFPTPYPNPITPVMTGDTASLAVGEVISTLPITRLQAARLDLAPWAPGVADTVVAAQVLLIPGNFPRMYDGTGTSELGFHQVPKIVAATNTGAGNLPLGTYQFQICFAYTDNQGRRHRSAPSTPVSVTGGSNFAALITWQMPWPSSKVGFGTFNGVSDHRFETEVYMTLINPGVNPPFFLVATVTTAVTPGNGVTGTAYNPVGGPVYGEQLYTQQGVILDNGPPPPMSHLSFWNRRVWGILEENRRGYICSKLINETDGIAFNENFSDVIDDEFGDLTATVGTLERFFLFKRDAIYFLTGDGPDDSGNGTFSQPARLDGAPGTLNPRSVLATEIGVFYQAPDNVIWLIGGDLSRTPIGDPTAEVPGTITSACLVPDLQEARFTTSAGTTLVFNLRYKRWTTNTGQPAVGACVFGGKWHYISTPVSGFARVRRDDPTLWQEAGSAYQASLELSWMSLGQIAGYARTWAVQIIGSLFGAHTFSITATADFGTTAVTRTVLSSVLKAAFGYRLEARLPLLMQQRTALKLLIQDNSPATSGWGIDALNLQVGVAPGRRPRIPASHVAG